MRGLVRIAGAVITVAALTVSGAVTSSAVESSRVAARVWLTTVDQSQLMREQALVVFHRGSSTLPTIVVDPEQTYQRVDGFGASITDSSAEVLYRLSPAAREDTLRRLFDPERGIGVSFLRQPVGSSDFTA